MIQTERLASVRTRCGTVVMAVAGWWWQQPDDKTSQLVFLMTTNVPRPLSVLKAASTFFSPLGFSRLAHSRAVALAPPVGHQRRKVIYHQCSVLAGQRAPGDFGQPALLIDPLTGDHFIIPSKMIKNC